MATRIPARMLWIAIACVAPEERPVRAPEARWSSARRQPVSEFARRWLPPVGGWESPRRPSLDARFVPEAVGATDLSDAEIVRSRGEALDERMAQFSAADLEAWSVGLLTGEELFGTEEAAGLREDPWFETTVRDDGERYDVTLSTWTYTALLGDPEPNLASITEGCVEGLAAAGGDPDAAVEAGACAEDEARTFFEEGSACRACVEANGGDYATCNAAETCPDEAAVAIWAADAEGAVHWYRGAWATAWACAPDWLVPFFFMVDMEEDGELPRAFDHERWAYICTWFWDEESGQVDTFCNGSEDPVARGALGEGLFGYVQALRPEGEDVEGWRGRQYYVDEVEFGTGAVISWFWASNPGLGAISAPRLIADDDGDGAVGPGDTDYGFGSGGFGLDPHEARPDGELQARDWLAVAQLKTSTTINGVPIFVYQRSRCATWDGPADDGSYLCTDMAAPEAGWINDGYTTWGSTERDLAVHFPMATLASTGLIDPDVPGGIVVHVAGSPALADPDYDACELPHRFVPDQAPFADVPLAWDGAASLDGHTWNFEAHADEDFRVVLHTNRNRDWCPGDADGGGHTYFDD